jgi:hypothetical protein
MSVRSSSGYVLVPVLFFVAISAVAVGVFASAAYTNLRVSDLDLAGPSGPGVGGGIPVGGEAGQNSKDFAEATVAGALEIIRVNPPPYKPNVNQGGTPVPVGQNPFGGNEVVNVDGQKVMLGVEFKGFADGPSPNAPIFADEGQPSIVLVGDHYNAYKGLSKKNWQGDLGGSYGNPWSLALTSEAYNFFAGDLGPSGQLVHFSKSPLTAVGGVQARRKIAVVNTQPLDALSGSPGLQVSGPVGQGGSGFIAAQASQYAASSSTHCGISEPGDIYPSTNSTGTVNKAAFDIVAKPLDEEVPEAQQCGVASLAAATAAAPGVVADGPVWNNATIAQRKKPILDKNGNPTTDCGSYSGRKDPAANTGDIPVIELEGAFGPDETKILNDWFRTCKATWHFVGDTFFDVYDPTQTDARQHSLVLDLYESNYVVGGFGPGLPQGERVPMNAFPNACDRNTPPAINGEVQSRGATITLSSRTGLRHNNGRVAICGPKQTGNTFHKTAIYQKRADDLVNWTPALQDQVLNAASCGTCVAFTQSGGTYQATTSGNSAFARLRFATADSGLQDGHLPLNLATLQANLTVNLISGNLFNAPLPKDGSYFRVKFRFPRPSYRFLNPVSGRTADFLECWSAYQPLTGAGPKTVSLSESGGSCLYRNADGTTQGAPTEVAIGEAVKYVGRCNAGPPFPLNTSTPDPNDRIDADSIEQTCSPQLDVEVQLTRNSNPAENLTVRLSNVSLTGSTTPGFTTPLGPLSVRWAPRELNNDGTNKPGDATFNVFGSVVLPHNAVEVRWGPRGRALGTPIFNGGVVPAQNCSYSNNSGCRPAVVAGALASWSTQGDASEGRCATCGAGNEGIVADNTSGATQWPEDSAGRALVPDVLARNSDGRKPRRVYLLTTCVVFDDRGTPTTTDDLMYPRAYSDVYTDDTQSGITVTGSDPEVIRSGSISGDGSFTQVGTCTRPAEFRS